MVNLETNINCPRMEEQHLVHLVKLVQNDHVLELLAWLEHKQQLLHKGSVGKIPPGIATWLVVVLIVRESESLAVAIQEVFEQKFNKHLLLNNLGQLSEKVEVVIFFESCKSISSPSVFEKLLNLPLQAIIDHLLSIEVFHGSKEF